MAGNKYLELDPATGLARQKAASDISSGAGDAGALVALDNTGRIDETMLPIGIGADTKLLPTTENLAAGDFVNVYNNASAFAVRLADASTVGKEANGFTLASVASGGNALIYFEGPNTQLTGLTPGRKFLSAATPGKAVASPPSAAGQVVQCIGVAVSATEINFEPGAPIVLA